MKLHACTFTLSLTLIVGFSIRANAQPHSDSCFKLSEEIERRYRLEEEVVREGRARGVPSWAINDKLQAIQNLTQRLVEEAKSRACTVPDKAQLPPTPQRDALNPLPGTVPLK